MKRKIYLIQPTYRRTDGHLQKGWNTFSNCISLPLLSATIPEDWEKEFCLEYFEDINFHTDAGVIVIFSMGFDIIHAREIAQKFRTFGKKIIFGGHLDRFSETIMKDVCDSVIRTNPNPKLMSVLLNDVLKGNIQPVYEGGLDLNFSFDYSVLKGKPIRYIPIFSCAGCHNNCEYCCTAALYNGKYRLRSIEVIIDDFRSARRLNRFAGFYDSNIYNNRQFLIRLCERIKGENLGLMWGAQSTIDIGDDVEVLESLKKAGCKILFIGLETISQKNLKDLNKPYHATKYLEQIHKIRKKGIHVVGYFILGLDHDTKDSIDNTAEFVKKSKISLPLFNVLVPVPGTDIFKRLKSENRLFINDEIEFIGQNPVYSVPCDCILYYPKNLTILDLLTSYHAFARKVSSWIQIIRRSVTFNPIISFVLLYVNIYFRKEYIKMAKARKIE